MFEFAYKKKKKQVKMWSQCLFLYIYLNSRSWLDTHKENNVIINSNVLANAGIVPPVTES